MHDDVYVCLALTAIAGPLVSVLVRWLRPRTATVVLTVTAVSLAVATWASLAILLLGALARLDIGSDRGYVAHRASLMRGLTRPELASAAALVMVCVAVASAAFVIRRGRAFVASFAHASSFAGRERVVVTPQEAADAYAVPGRPGRVVVSAGMLRALDPTDLQVLLAHEHAHLNHRHHLHATLVRLAVAANPFLRPLARAADFQIERWADEIAAQEAASRHHVATTISKAAVASSRTLVRRPTLGLGIAPGRRSLRSAGPVPRRVAALLAPATPNNPVALGAIVAILLLGALLVGEAAGDLAGLLAVVPDALT